MSAAEKGAAGKGASLRSPLSRALGHGAAKDGVGHWWLQRVTSAALVPLTIWFVFALVTLPSLEYAVVRSWLAAGWTPVFAVLLVLVTCHHSVSGVQVVIEDYVHGKSLKVAALLLSQFVHALLAVACVFAIAKIAFQAVA